MEASKRFYMDVLGFKIYMEHNLTGSDRGENLFGVPQNIYKEIERKICILNPIGENFGSVELVELNGIDGKDFSQSAKPPNLGILMLRFPVQNIDKLKRHLESKDVPIINFGTLDIAPYGTCKTLAIQSPDGAWLEFVELEAQ